MLKLLSFQMLKETDLLADIDLVDSKWLQFATPIDLLFQS